MATMNKAPLSNEINAHLETIEKDGMTVFVMADGQFRGAMYNGTKMINQMRANLNTGILETYILGQAMLCAALLIQTMKGKEHITFNYETDGICKGFSVEADSTGWVRGHLLQDSIPLEKPLESWDMAPFFGNGGTLTIRRFGEGMKEPQVSSVEIMYKNIALDLAYYFDQSDQIHTAFNTSIRFDEKGNVIGACGMFLQAMPNAGGKSRVSAQTEDSGEEDKEEKMDILITKVENALRAMPPLGNWVSEQGTREDMVYGLFREFNPTAVLERDIIFDCPCTKENFIKSIKALPTAELKDILENEKFPLEILCHNCGSIYQISKEELI